MSGEEHIMEVENRYSEYKFVNSNETINYVNFLEKKDNLTVGNSEMNFLIDLKFSSYTKILNQMDAPLELLVNYIKFITISQTVNYETETEPINYNAPEEYKKLLEITKYFYVIKPEYSNLEDKEKIEYQIILLNNSLRKIMKLAGNDFIQSLSYMDIVITTISYEYLIHKKKKLKNLDSNIKKLLDNNLIYNIGDDIIISDYSIKKILSLSGFNLYDLSDYLKIKQFKGDEELRKKKINNLNKITKYFSNIQKIKNNENNIIKNFTGNDISEKNKEIKFDDIEFSFNEASNLIDDIINKLNNKKKVIYDNCDNDNNLFICVTNKNGNSVFIRKIYIKLIENYPNDKISNFDVIDINNKNVLIPKNNLKNISSDNNYILIKNNNNEILLVKKDDLKKIYNEWKYLKEKKEINSKNPDKINKIELLNNNIIIQNEINNLPNQSEEEELNIFKKEKLEKEKLLNDKKNNLLKEINNPTNNTLIEIQPNKLINSSLYNQIINNNEEKDEYIIPEYLTKNNTPVSKKNLKSINLTDENQCIILEDLTKKKKIILRINEIKTKINSENKQILRSYEGNEEEINLLNLNILKLEDEKLPENNPENENLKKMLENALILIKIGENLVPKNIIDKINEDKSNKNEFEVISIQSPKNKYIKINKSQVKKNNDNPSFIEINIEENDEKKYVKKMDIEKNINNNNDEMYLEDFRNNKFKVKKNKIIISQNNNNYNLEKQIQDYIDDIKKNIDYNKTLIDIIDENGNNNLVRKEYINLIKNDKSSIDIFEIPNIKGEKILISKKKIKNLNNNEYIPIINLENNKLHYINIKNLDEKHNEFINEIYEFDEFNNNNKLPIKVKNIIISQDKNNIINLPFQKEENFIKDLIKKREIINENNDNSDIILMNDNNNEQMYVFYKNITDINNDIQKFNLDNNLNQKYNKRENYKIVDVKGVEHLININHLKISENINRYCIISVNKQRKLVDKNNLKNELNKADNSKYKMQNLKNVINNNENFIISPQDFQFDIIQAFDLPEQEKLIEKKNPSFNFENNNNNDNNQDNNDNDNSDSNSNFDSGKEFIIDFNSGNNNKIEMDEITTSKEPISFKSKPLIIQQKKLPPKNLYNIRGVIMRKKKKG